MSVTPYRSSDKQKKEQVEWMFDNIAPKYDFLNHILSAGIDKLWRRKAVRLLAGFSYDVVLDVATGTGDFAVETSRLNPKEIVGLDLSEKMLEVGRAKVIKLGLEGLIRFEKGDSEELPFADESFDAITVGFGVRNFENLEIGLKEFHRVLKANGVAVILEFSRPRSFPMSQFYRFYFKRILPFIGGIVSKDQSAYTYLPESVMAFPDGDDFLKILRKTGFRETSQTRLSMGIASIYIAKK